MTSTCPSSHPPSPSPTKVRFNIPSTSFSTATSAADSDDASSSSFDSDSDGVDRVFFGSPKAGEEALVARLSKTAPATPRSRLSKRDSREFLRRKTILVTPPRRPAFELDDEEEEGELELSVVKEGPEKKWPGGFHERRQSLDMSDAASSNSSSSGSPTPALCAETPGRQMEDVHCDLTLDLSRFRISESPLSNLISPSRPTTLRRPSLLSRPSLQPECESKSDAESSESESEEEEEWSDTDGEDSDKENAPAPVESHEDDEEERVDYPLFDGPLTGSVMEHADAIELLRGLDMGGLCLYDFADPELDIGTLLLATEYHSEYGFSSREPSENGLDRIEDGEGSSGFSAPNDDTVKLPTMDTYALRAPSEHRDVLSEITIEALPTDEPDVITIAEDLNASTITILSPSPSVPFDATYPTSLPSIGTPSPNFDSPLPIARGGPVVIPQFDSPIRADSSSPVRPYNSQILVEAFTPPPIEPAEPFRLAAAAMQPSPPSQLSQSNSSSSGSGKNYAITPSASRCVPANAQFQTKQALKSSLTASTNPFSASLAPSSPLPLPIVASTRELTDEEASKRSEAIKRNLASVFSGKSLGLGAPQRSVSASSSHSSSAGSGSTTSRPGSRMGGVMPGQTDKGKGKQVGISAVPVMTEGRTIPTGPVTRKRLPPVASSAGSTITASSSAAAPFTSIRPPLAASGPSRRPAAAPPRAVLAPRTLPPVQPTLPQPGRTAAKAAPPRAATSTIASTARPTRQALPQSTLNLAQSQRAPQLSKMPIYLCAQPLAPTSPNSQSYTVSVSTHTNPLKRPLPTSFASYPAVTNRSAVSVGGGQTRPTLGLPSRVVGDQVFTLASTRMASVFEGSPPPNELGGSTGPTFSLGYPGEGGTTMRSPAVFGGRAWGGDPVKGTPMSIRTNRLGTPSRSKLGTPSRNLGTPSRIVRRGNGPAIQVFSARPEPVTTSSSDKTNPISTSPTTAPPPANPRFAAFGSSATASGSGLLGAQRGSSEDQEEVSFALPTLGGGSSEVGSSPLKTPQEKSPAKVIQVAVPESSPAAHAHAHGRDVHPSKLVIAPDSTEASPTDGNTRPKRTIKPPAPRPIPVPRVATSVAGKAPSIASNMSENELKAKTKYNTVRNEKYFCAIDRQIVRVGILRPPSPTSTIPTVEQREEEAKKRDREVRAQRRKGKDKAGSEELEVEDEEEVLPIVRRLEGGEVDWKGDEEGWEEVRDERPAKRSRVGSVDRTERDGSGGARCVKWDKGLVVIRDEGGPYTTLAERVPGGRSALKSGKQIELDQNGNVIPNRRPKEAIKPLKVAVTVMVYEGEEPILPISQATRGKKKA